ncbi:MAG: hydantoinase/oxoprolinase family protein, partial [Rhodobacteraceae bacterium]|nr:hydantoinase/oxoprolinase family protein [Paracoccaceae bacterium]
TRNPEHEIAARAIIRTVTGAPVTCSHELSARLGGPKRAMTALLNARLIGLIADLIEATETLLRQLEISAPLMVVRGDGALISADLARERPIETILSGPAASIVGARWLTDEKDAIVSDIGGTTTDVALLRAGHPMIDPDGAMVGGLRTMVEAVAMRTTGLGGDSEVSLAGSSVRLGPHRVLPVSLCAVAWPELVHGALDRMVSADRIGEYDGRFVVPLGSVAKGLNERQMQMLGRLGDTACEMSSLIRNRLDEVALQQLVGRGAVIISGITPSDAAHVLGRLDSWDKRAADKALQLFARRRTSAGITLGEGAEALACMIVDQLTEQTAQTLLEAAFAEDNYDFDQPVGELARHVLTQKGLDHHRGVVALDVGLNLPLIGLGASAHSYYGAVGKRLNCKVVVPEHAGVANAIGAVVGQISMRLKGQITSVGEGRYRVHFIAGLQDFGDLDQALAALKKSLGDAAQETAQDSGGVGIRLRFEQDIKSAEIEGRRVFVEAEVTAIATGRPRISAEN